MNLVATVFLAVAVVLLAVGLGGIYAHRVKLALDDPTDDDIADLAESVRRGDTPPTRVSQVHVECFNTWADGLPVTCPCVAALGVRG